MLSFAIRCAPARRSVSTYSGLTSADFMKKKTNEPILEYRKGSKERQDLEAALAHYSKVNKQVFSKKQVIELLFTF